VTREDLKAEFLAHPELRGKMFWPKAGGTGCSWSVTLLEMAGGYERLMQEWQEDE
jgi:hypothetical protein